KVDRRAPPRRAGARVHARRRARHGLSLRPLAGARGAARARHPELRGELGRDLDPRVGRAVLGGRRAPRPLRAAVTEMGTHTEMRTQEIGTHTISRGARGRPCTAALRNRGRPDFHHSQRGVATGLVLLLIVLAALALWWFEPWRGLGGSE